MPSRINVSFTVSITPYTCHYRMLEVPLSFDGRESVRSYKTSIDVSLYETSQVQHYYYVVSQVLTSVTLLSSQEVTIQLLFITFYTNASNKPETL